MRKFVCKPLPGDASDPQGLTALVDRYLLWMETHHYAPGTVKVRRVTLAHFLRWCLERSITRPHTVTPEMLERFQRHVYYYRQRNGQGLSLSSQSHRLTALRSWCAWLTKQHVLEQDPARDLVLPREEQRLPRQPLSVAEVEAVLAQADLTTPHGLRNRAILEVLYSTALRREEALRLEHTDLDRERRTLLVRLGKGKKDRFVPIGQRAGLDRQVPGRSPAAPGAPRRNAPGVRLQERSPVACQPLIQDRPRLPAHRRHQQAWRVPSLQTFRSDTHARSRCGRPFYTGSFGALEIVNYTDLHPRLDHEAARGARAHPSGAPLPPARHPTTSGGRPGRRRGRRPGVGAGGVSHPAGHRRSRAARPTVWAVPHRPADKISLPSLPGIDYNHIQFFDM